MRAVAQRVTRAEVRRSDGSQVLGRIERGLLVLIGIGPEDSEADALWLLDKLVNLRVFADRHAGGDAASDAMDRSLRDCGGGLLLVSQFTLYADTRKGRRPSFTGAMAPGPARVLYERVVALARDSGVPVASGEFGAMMHIELVNDGPVTLCLDSSDRPGRPPAAAGDRG